MKNGHLRGKHYPDEFRRRAVALGDEIGAYEAAYRLGIPTRNLMSWMSSGVRLPGMTRKPTPEEKALIEAQAEIRRLKKENEELTKANAVLKAVSSFFSKDRLSSSSSRSESSSKKTKK